MPPSSARRPAGGSAGVLLLKRGVRPALAIALMTTPLSAQENSADRAEMDLAAGRVLFQNSPLSTAIIEVRSGPVVPSPAPVARPRQVRVIVPSPYAR